VFKVHLSEFAKEDIRDAAQWYNTKEKGLGKRFTKSVRDKVKFIKNNPNASSIRYKNVRTAICDRFPYMIHYLVDDSIKRIVINVNNG